MGEREAEFLKQLKTATAAQHEGMEADPLLAQLFSPQLTRDQYICYLSLFLQVSLAYESVILPTSISNLKGWKVTNPSRKIYADLESLAADPIQPVHPYRLPEGVQAPAFALGFTYVMEGSKLGGKVLSRAVCRTLAISETAGAAYLSDQGQESFPLWKQFLDQFSEFVIFSAAEKLAVEGADRAFESIAAFFASNSELHELPKHRQQ